MLARIPEVSKGYRKHRYEFFSVDAAIELSISIHRSLKRIIGAIKRRTYRLFVFFELLY